LNVSATTVTECVTNYTALTFISSKILTLPYTFIRNVHYISLGSSSYYTYIQMEDHERFSQKSVYVIHNTRQAVAQLFKATSQKVEGSISDGVIGIFALPHYRPGVDPTSNINECQDYFLGVKEAGA